MRSEHPYAPFDILEDYRNMKMSHTVGPEGFIPAILAGFRNPTSFADWKLRTDAADCSEQNGPHDPRPS